MQCIACDFGCFYSAHHANVYGQVSFNCIDVSHCEECTKIVTWSLGDLPTARPVAICPDMWQWLVAVWTAQSNKLAGTSLLRCVISQVVTCQVTGWWLYSLTFPASRPVWPNKDEFNMHTSPHCTWDVKHACGIHKLCIHRCSAMWSAPPRVLFPSVMVNKQAGRQAGITALLHKQDLCKKWHAASTKQIWLLAQCDNKARYHVPTYSATDRSRAA